MFIFIKYNDSNKVLLNMNDQISIKDRFPSFVIVILFFSFMLKCKLKNYAKLSNAFLSKRMVCTHAI